MTTRRTFIRQSSLTGLCLGIGLVGRTNDEFAYRSGYIRLKLNAAVPKLTEFSTDSLGQGRFLPSPLLADQGGGGTVAGAGGASAVAGATRAGLASAVAYRSEIRGGDIHYYTGSGHTPAWAFRCSAKKIEIRTRWVEGQQAEPFPIAFSQKLNHSTVLGRLAGKNELTFPCVLHLPGMGSFRIYCSDPAVMLGYDAYRFAFPGEKGEPFVSVSFAGADKEHPDIRYTLESAAIYREPEGRVKDDRLDGYRRNYINIFQLNPRLQVLANNSASDACTMTLFFYTEMARGMPELVKGLSAMDLVRHSLDRYLSGWKGYGQVGYDTPIGWQSEYDASDSLPSLIISACYYIQDSGDSAWAQKNYPGVRAWADQMIATDRNNDGIIEYGYSGNENSWGGQLKRPANWWDTVGFGHDDAYSNALAFHALTQLARIAGRLGHNDDLFRLAGLATRLKDNYYDHFYHAETGLLAGWKSEDGQLHDYAFTFVNSVAVCYGVVSRERSEQLMTRLMEKMREVGYADFRLGLPGNLVPIRPGDYVDKVRRWGYGSKPDGSDGFQKYENGGATACFTYYTIRALQQLNRHAEADAILYPMLESFKGGGFEGACPGSEMTKDWKTWKGECWGYEGFLVDNYLTFLAV